jgi:hypothetical protein
LSSTRSWLCETPAAPPPNPSSCGSLVAAVPGLVPLIWPADDRSSMGSDAPRSVRPMGATNRAVIPITVMVRIWLANAHSPIGADASGSVDPIGTSGCVARLSEHKRGKCNHDGEHRGAKSDESQRSVFHFGYLLDYRSARLFHRYSTIKTPAIPPGFCPCSISRCRGCIISVGQGCRANNGFAASEPKFADSPLEGYGFEPSVPRHARTADSATLV